MIAFDLVMQFSFQLDFAHLVQVAVEHAAAFKDLASALYYLSMASYFFRKDPNNK